MESVPRRQCVLPAFLQTLQEVNGRGAEQEKLSVAFAFAPPLVDQTPQRREDTWQSMDFIEDDQPICVLREVEFWLGQLCAVRRQLQVEVNRLRAKFFRQRVRERGLAHLPWAKQCHGRKLLQELSQSGLGKPGNHTL